ncbi:hypothetical protein DNTS_026161 [Danionella cerebrum]|uniref:Uncharacterized protein n=1 Tax=Danionella cerebrum TaxID=2873325 RepID=A0A553QZW3_9TELE|nr:hypothetical protein DNTS_026161 [Danionella translucida]
MGNENSCEDYGNRSYIMYHGTTMKKAKKIKRKGFKPSYDGMLGQGVYVSRSFEKASHYPVEFTGESLAILKLRVHVGRVKKIDYQGHPLQKSWHQHGYDCAWVPPNCGMVQSGLEEDCVYDPKRIEVLEIIPNIRNSDYWSPYSRWLVNVMGNENSCEDYGNRSYIMYHGTTMKKAKKIKRKGFKPSYDGMLGQGVYVSRSFEKAARYPLGIIVESLAILKLRVRVGKVKKIDYQGHPLQKSWHQHGYDCAWVPPNCGMVPSGLEEDCVYDPKRIEVLEIIPHIRRPNYGSPYSRCQ